MSDENRSEKAEQSTHQETGRAEASQEATNNINANAEAQNSNESDRTSTEQQSAEADGAEASQEATNNINANAEAQNSNERIPSEDGTIQKNGSLEGQAEDERAHELVESEKETGKEESTDENEGEKTKGRELAILGELPEEQLTGLHEVSVVGDLGKATFTDSEGVQHEGEVTADYNRGTGEIRITEGSLADDDSAQATLYHEVGHNVWFNNLTEDERQEWNKFWGDYKDQMPTEYATSNNAEGFAECYSSYQSDTLRENPDHPEWADIDTWFGSHDIRRKGETNY